jgi:hypothetical protein
MIEIRLPHVTGKCPFCKHIHEAEEEYYWVTIMSRDGSECVKQKGSEPKFVFREPVEGDHTIAPDPKILESMWTIDLRTDSNEGDKND